MSTSKIKTVWAVQKIYQNGKNNILDIISDARTAWRIICENAIREIKDKSAVMSAIRWEEYIYLRDKEGCGYSYDMTQYDVN